MIIHTVTQGTTEWSHLRAGIPTASAFDKIITPRTRKPSSQRTPYMHSLIAERLMGHPIDDFKSDWMARGKRLEEEAALYYESLNDVTTQVVGHVTNDTRTIGASPDRFVGDDGLLEIKVPKEHTHVGYLLTHEIDADYYPQVQGQMWICARAWADVLSYHPEMPPALIRVRRDEEFIGLLAKMLDDFVNELETKFATLTARGLEDRLRASVEGQ